jgi:hypothetical protein
VFNLLVGPKEEHGMLPPKPPYAPVLLAATTSIDWRKSLDFDSLA